MLGSCAIAAIEQKISNQMPIPKQFATTLEPIQTLGQFLLKFQPLGFSDVEIGFKFVRADENEFLN